MNPEELEQETPQTPEEEKPTEENQEATEGAPETSEAEKPETSNELKSALAQKDHFREKAEKAESERAKAIEDLKRAQKASGGESSMDVEDFIDINTALDGLDPKEKEYLVQQHKMSGKALSEIRDDENFKLWQSAYRQKVEKNKTLEPSNTQSESDAPMSVAEALKTASLEEKEKILADAGLYKTSRPRQDRVKIGGDRFAR